MNAQTILVIYLLLFAVEFLWEQALTLLNLGYAASGRRRPPQAVLAVMDREAYLRSVDYTLARGRLGLVSGTFGAAFLLVLVLGGWLGRLEALIRPLRIAPAFQGILFIYSVSLAFGLISLPFSIYSQFVIEERFGFNRKTARLFLVDLLKSLALSLVLTTPLLYLLFRLIRATPIWWLWAFALYCGFQFLMIFLYPRLIAPLFNKFSSLQEGEVKERIVELAQRLGCKTRGIFIMDGSRRSQHSNAYFSGLGRAKRIVLFDTLLQRLGPDQVAAVLAHEIGHERKGHVLRRLVVSLAASLAGFWILSRLIGYGPLFQAFGFASPSPQAALVLAFFLSSPFTLILKPLASWWSRRQEYEADRFAYREAACGVHFSEALIALGKENLSNPAPHPWYSFYHCSHPTLVERLRALQQP